MTATRRTLEQIRAHLAAMPFLDGLGMEIVAAADGAATAVLPLSRRVAWNDTAFAGAFVGLLADNAAGAAALAMLPADRAPVTIAVDLTVTGPTAGARLRADATLASHAGNTLVFTVVVHAEDGAASTACGVSLVHLRAVPITPS
jgi:uncharacterized protein (TIGR00369 family)